MKTTSRTKLETTHKRILAADYMQTLPGSVILAAARGDLDLNAYARIEMANRGLGQNGMWIGHDEAREIWNLDKGTEAVVTDDGDGYLIPQATGRGL